MDTEKSCGAFTQRFPALSNKLTSKAQAVWKGKSWDAVALWDTGATVTCISTALAKELRLVATGGRALRTPAGSKIVNFLLNKAGILYNLSNKIYITHFLELIILVHAIDSRRQEYVRYQGKKIDSYVAGSIVY